ncbi:hypothetical protein CC85DRAFT_311473 [Cutaneotrichosporon oleaginosum]|uniref:Ricin B lectin domain-containing protein n=1 Tax=Cutaneotrichosporon oleaginosum TaxID=879819 RepID=A0A0J0XRY9_9TREE|nr:uncharacterized protein CC85DRAFT_311473 [Cutaneotrichosporon oleaginosum]KLT43852.1 hypothetical protein CC85DRAFT_311473 [Cutaneotrichosporon oleaginosum]TXT06408.1 hypothetical protein COLE_05739 [Cutaneotrichosporon oleaginosum]
MVAFTTLIAVLASTAAYAAPLEPRRNAPTRIQARVSNTRVGNLCIAPGPGTDATVILKSCSDQSAAVTHKDNKLVFSSGVAEVAQGSHTVPWVKVRPASDSMHQTFTSISVENGNYIRFKTADGHCLTVGEPVLPGPARVRVSRCEERDVNQDFRLA